MSTFCSSFGGSEADEDTFATFWSPMNSVRDFFFCSQIFILFMRPVWTESIDCIISSSRFRIFSSFWYNLCWCSYLNLGNRSFLYAFNMAMEPLIVNSSLKTGVEVISSRICGGSWESTINGASWLLLMKRGSRSCVTIGTCDVEVEDNNSTPLVPRWNSDDK